MKENFEVACGHAGLVEAGRPQRLEDLATEMREVYNLAVKDLGELLGGRPVLELMADNFPEQPLRALEDALVVAGIRDRRPVCMPEMVQLVYIGEPYYVNGKLMVSPGTEGAMPKVSWESDYAELSLVWKPAAPKIYRHRSKAKELL